MLTKLDFLNNDYKEKKTPAQLAEEAIEKDIISKHMWPVTFSAPKYLESYTITFVDKYCAVKELINYCKYTIWSWYLNWFYI